MGAVSRCRAAATRASGPTPTTRAARSCTSTWTPSSPRSRCAAGPSCAAGRWWSAASGRAAWSARPATRPARYGVRSAMPTGRARALCPAGGLPAARLRRATRRPRDAVMRIFRDVTPLVEPLSLDEAFLDVAGARRLLGAPGRDRPADPRPGRRRAGADLLGRGGADQVRGQARLHPGQAGRAARGAGRPGARVPAPAAGRRAVGRGGAVRRDAAPARPAHRRRPGRGARRACCARRSAAASATHLHELAWGRDPRRVSPEQVEKSIGAETTFDVDVADPRADPPDAARPVDKVGGRLRGGRSGRPDVAIKVRLADFRTRQPLPHPAARHRRGPGDLRHGLGALRRFSTRASRIRLVGVRVEGLAGAGDAPRQLTLGAPERGWREAEAAADAAAARFGRSVVGPASLLGRRDRRRRRKSHPRP